MTESYAREIGIQIAKLLGNDKFLCLIAAEALLQTSLSKEEFERYQKEGEKLLKKEGL